MNAYNPKDFYAKALWRISLDESPARDYLNRKLAEEYSRFPIFLRDQRLAAGWMKRNQRPSPFWARKYGIRTMAKSINNYDPEVHSGYMVDEFIQDGHVVDGNLGACAGL